MGPRMSIAGALAALALCLAGTVPAQAQKPAARPDAARQVEVLAQAQAEMQQQLAELRQAVDRLNEQIQAAAGAAGEQRAALAAAEGAARTAQGELAELVRGLYVEVNGVKGDLALARTELQQLAATHDSARFGSGLLIALVIALQIGLILLAIRARR